MHIFLGWQMSPKKTSQTVVKIKMGEMQNPPIKKSCSTSATKQLEIWAFPSARLRHLYRKNILQAPRLDRRQSPHRPLTICRHGGKCREETRGTPLAE